MSWRIFKDGADIVSAAVMGRAVNLAAMKDRGDERLSTIDAVKRPNHVMLPFIIRCFRRNHPEHRAAPPFLPAARTPPLRRAVQPARRIHRHPACHTPAVVAVELIPA